MTPTRQAIAFEMAQRIIASGKPLYYSFAAAAEALRLVAEYNNIKSAGNKPWHHQS